VGRIRNDREASFFCDRAAEIVDLFGTEDCSLYRAFGEEDFNLDNKDPVWSEPTTTVKYKRYNLPCSWREWNSNVSPTEEGEELEIDAQAYLAVNHLVSNGVIKDNDKEYVAPGDILAIHDKCGHETFFYDILQTNRTGWINSSDKFTGYNLDLKRRDKYVPERKTADD
jgi:hypothetical protein